MNDRLLLRLMRGAFSMLDTVPVVAPGCAGTDAVTLVQAMLLYADGLATLGDVVDGRPHTVTLTALGREVRVQRAAPCRDIGGMTLDEARAALTGARHHA